MGGKREKPEDIVLKLRQVEVLQGQGKPLADAVRQIGVTGQTLPASNACSQPQAALVSSTDHGSWRHTLYANLTNYFC